MTYPHARKHTLRLSHIRVDNLVIDQIWPASFVDKWLTAKWDNLIFWNLVLWFSPQSQN